MNERFYIVKFQKVEAEAGAHPAARSSPRDPVWLPVSGCAWL